MNIKRGEIWLVTLDPMVSTEMRRTRPVVVISSNALGILPMRLIAPLTGWKDIFENNLWHIKIVPDRKNKLDRLSAVDIFQIRCMETKQFINRIGMIPHYTMKDIAKAAALVIEYEK